jgi:Ca-activated chloride channel homolog
MMHRHAIYYVLVLVLVSAAHSQSGRRTTATDPTPAATPARTEDPTQYSESRPQTRRSDRVPNRFPDQSLKKTPEPQQTSQPAIVSAADDDVLRIETNLVTIPVSVFDRSGLYVPGIRQEEFSIFENGEQQEIAYFGVSDKPFTVALLLDTSPSTQYKIDEIHEAAIAFVKQLGPNDRVIVIEFHGDVKVQSEATNDRQKIYKAIRKAKFGWGTSLYNAVDEALRKQLGKVTGRKAVVLFTDGVDTTSRKNSYDSTLEFAEESDSLIFPIYYNTYTDNNATYGGVMSPAGTSAAEYALGHRYLEELAGATGGRVFRPETTPGGLTRAFEGIAEELRRQYNIGYVPKSEGRLGERRTIKVRVQRPNLIVRARDSYIVGGTAASPAPAKK